MFERPIAAGRGKPAYTILAPVMATAATAVAGILLVLVVALGSGEPSSGRHLVPVAGGAALLTIAVAVTLGRRLRQAVAGIENHAADARRIAFEDPATGLPNDAALRRILVDEIDGASDGRRTALVAVDLDVGPDPGVDPGSLDRAVSDLLARAVRGTDTVARTTRGFAVLLTDTARKDDVRTICDRIVAGVGQGLDVERTSVPATVRLGVALAPDHGGGPDDLLRKAGLALSHADAGGVVRFFEDRFDDPGRRRDALVGELRRSLDRGGEIGVLYQPIVGSDGETPVGMEALARWNHPDDGPRPPAEFLPIAEETGLIRPLGETVIRQALRTAAPLDRLSLAVNLSPVQLAAPDLSARVDALLEATAFHPARLEIEVTETALVTADGRALATLAAFRSRGARVVVDDFGAGSAAIGLLRGAPVDRVKLDPSLLRGAQSDPGQRALGRALVAAAGALGLPVTAEGVETDAQFDLAADLGCDLFQGFLFSPPVPAGVMIAYAAGEPLPVGRRRVRLATGAA
jgi:EAL domain-containing protein (putative c-di-GMP-specific phosphodiesterase class I)/GGDEF domain-containing protein